MPVPALTANQVLSDALNVQAGQTVLVNGAAGVTGSLIVQLAAHYGATVLATASPPNAERIRALGAAHVLDYHQPDWPGQVRTLTSGGADMAANAVRSGAGDAMRAVRDGGRLATITADAPAAERGITVREVQVVPDGARLGRLAALAARGTLTVPSPSRIRCTRRPPHCSRPGTASTAWRPSWRWADRDDRPTVTGRGRQPGAAVEAGHRGRRRVRGGGRLGARPGAVLRRARPDSVWRMNARC